VPRELFLPLPDFAGLGERFAECSRVFAGIRAAFFDVDLLMEILRFAFALGAAGLLAWAFFFFDLGIIEGACGFRRQKRRLN
jgi:hypothetical protein